MTPDTFRLNAYRVLRIPVSASASDIQKAAARMRQAEPGLYKTSEIDVPQLGDVSRDDSDIRAAVDRLANPVHRLTDRLLWFCKLPTPGSARHTSSAMDPAGHDAVIRELFDVMRGGLDEPGLAAWVKTLRAWHAVTNDDDYWFLSLINEDQGGFEPTASASEVDAVRADAVRIAAEPLLVATHAALAANDKDPVRRVLTALSSLTDTGPWAAASIKELETGFLQPCS
jgi:hypothetical protein